MLQLREASRLIESGQEVDICFFTCNRGKKTGGEFIKGHKVRATGSIHKKTQTVNLLFQDGVHRKAHLKLITHLNGELVI